jgi:hypothetical protein
MRPTGPWMHYRVIVASMEATPGTGRLHILRDSDYLTGAMTRVARVKPCKERLETIIKQLKDRRSFRRL